MLVDTLILLLIYLVAIVLSEKYKQERYDEKLRPVDYFNCCAISLIIYDVFLIAKYLI